ncbi:hypothetical protein GJU40_00795 [Bacillus lacus]|uniref:Spore germination protein n=1 Tax=Metabacillus lacus TaxID=1983721 RepID=A0A7X2IVT7_9BACI|nr:hypothetical protein [Metabacillus lacus]MRX70706.1 hypothetical protein [Metabacillus lacus]
MGVYIKSLFINHISGGVVHFGNAVRVGNIETSKSASAFEENGGTPAIENPTGEIELSINIPAADTALNQ